MTAENFENSLNELQDQKPFQVFTVQLHGGERIEVDHAKALVVRKGVAVFLPAGGGFKLFDHKSVLQLEIAHQTPL